MVDLVADQEHVVGFAPRAQRRQLLRGDHGAGRVRGRGRSAQGSAAVLVLELGDGGLETLGGAAIEVDHLTAERAEILRSSRVAGAGERHAVPGVEGREEGEQETTRNRWSRPRSRGRPPCRTRR